MASDFYDGAVQQTADFEVPVPQVPQMRFEAQEAVQQAAVSSARGMQGALSGVTRLMSYKAMADADLKRKGVQRTFEQEHARAMQAAPGTDGSFFHEDGSLDTDKVDDFTARYRDALKECDPGVVLPNDRVRWDAEHADFTQTSVDRLVGKTELEVADSVKRVGRSILAECELNEDWAGYEREVSHQNEAGLLTDAEARVMLRRQDARKAVKAQKGTKAAHLNLSPVQKGKTGTFDGVSFD